MPAPRVQARRIFIIDDDRDTVESLAAVLRMMGHDVAFTTDSTEALVLVTQSRPEIVLTDLGMPRLNGYDLCRSLRALPEFKEACIVAISGYGDEESRAKSRRAGFDAHVRKPIDFHVLDAILTQFGKPLERRSAPR